MYILLLLLNITLVSFFTVNNDVAHGSRSKVLTRATNKSTFSILFSIFSTVDLDVEDSSFFD
uniref:Putative ovule protein n=1 Tax=Solanum chacoense TaxID=4108 RepID=A0A0V0GQN0_SOLCH